MARRTRPGRLIPGRFHGIGAAPVSPASALTITFEPSVGAYDPTDPGGGEHGPYAWIESGAHYAGVWLTDVGTPQGGSQIGHTHITSNVYGSGYGDLAHSWYYDLQCGLLTLIGGGAFDVVSIDYRIEQREIEPGIDPWSYFEQRLPWSIPVDDVHLMLSSEGQPAAFDIDDGSVLDLGNSQTDWRRPASDVMLRTPNVTGFEGVTSLYIAHTAHFAWIFIRVTPLRSWLAS